MGTSPQEKLLLFEALDVIGNTTILGVFYGISFALYCLCARLLYLQLREPDKRRQTRFTLGYISLLFFCATVYVALSSRLVQLGYVDHADFPGGPLAYEGSYNPTINLILTTTGIFVFIIQVSTMAIQIWRLWIIWKGTQYTVAVTVLPVLLLLSYMALYALGNIIVGWLPISQLGISASSYTTIDTASYAILTGLTVLVTPMITIRLLLVRRHHIKIMGTSNAPTPYLSIIAMLIESYALESVWSIASAISIGLHLPPIPLLAAVDPVIKIISYFLVVYRVARGRGWTTQTGREITSLQWNRSAQLATGGTKGMRSPEPATTAVVVIGSPSVSVSRLTV